MGDDVKGKLNTITDIFSHWYQFFGPADHVNPFEFVSADRRLDPEGVDLPVVRFLEICEYDSTVLTKS
jgi:hypothetical protein